jgi:hypothetical protein
LDLLSQLITVLVTLAAKMAAYKHPRRYEIQRRMWQMQAPEEKVRK